MILVNNERRQKQTNIIMIWGSGFSHRCKSSTKQVEEATTEEAPGSIVICTEEEVNTFNRDVKRSVLSLGHFISFSFATKEVKGVNYFPPRANEACEAS